MQASEIFSKTPKGQSEIANKSNDLSLKERRVLILVNGENNTARLKQLSLCENIAEILDNLLRLGFIEQQGGSGAAPEPAASEETAAAGEIGARAFMCNTLLTFANRIRVAKLIEEINAADNIEEIKNMVKPWYMAISEPPGGMYQADDLCKEVLEMIHNEELGGMAQRVLRKTGFYAPERLRDTWIGSPGQSLLVGDLWKLDPERTLGQVTSAIRMSQPGVDPTVVTGIEMVSASCRPHGSSTKTTPRRARRGVNRSDLVAKYSSIVW